MAYKSTSNPPGRPPVEDKFKQFSFKAPLELLNRVQAYARQHRQTLSELVREGLEWRIGDGDPWGSDSEHSGSEYDRHTDTGILQALLEAQARQEAQLKQLTQALAARTVLTASPVIKGNTGHTETVAVTSPEPEGEYAQAAEPLEPVVTSITSGVAAAFDYDATKYVLGRLCPRGHAHGDTGKSLLRGSNRHCLACDREKFHERKQAKRQAQPDSAKPPANHEQKSSRRARQTAQGGSG